MADTKISALTAATTPLAGTEVLPIVQGGVTKQVSVADLTAGRAVSASSLTLTNALTAANGGTGQSSYTIGDILYASGATALSKLADVATGNALISGGVGVAPSWGKIGLTTHVTGTLPTANGGTGLTSFTANGVLYASSTSALATSANLLYDGSSFGVGPAGITPAYAFQVSNTSGELFALYNNRTSSGGGNFRIFKSRGSYASPTVALTNDDIGTIQFRVYARNSGDTANEYIDSARIQAYASAVDAQNRVSSSIGFFTVSASGALTRQAVIDPTGQVGIGTSTPSYLLDVAGFGRMGVINRAGTYTAGTTTPSVSGVSYMVIANSAPTTITNFTGGQAGQVIYLLFDDANTTVNRSNAYLAGGTNFVSTANDTLTLVSDGTYWYEIARSANS